MKLETAQTAMSLHRKQMADALTHRAEDMLGFHYAAFRHRQLMEQQTPRSFRFSRTYSA